MIRIINIGMNHETAPVELRECMAKDPEHADKALAMMRESPCIKEGVFLSTCNRVEALFATEQVEEAKDSVIQMLCTLGEIPSERLCSGLFTYEDHEAVRHIFRVASSLDSMVIGEPQILGQIKEAYSNATREKATGVILNRLLHRAFHTAKRVRTETGISDAAVSVSYAAVELAKKIFYDFKGKKVLLIGAGEMAELAARHLLTQGVSAMAVANRTFQKAVEVAQTFRGTPVSFEEIGAQLLEADIVISSTAAPGYVITHDQVKGSMKKRKNRPLFFIDIAVPRDVEPAVNELENVYVYDIDDLKGIIQVNLTQRQEEAVKAERIVEEEVLKFEQWLKTLEVVPTIVSLKEKAESIRQTEVKKSLASLGELSPSQLKSLETLTLSIAEKILNDPILFLKQKADRPLGKTYLDTARWLFRLDQENGEEVKHGSKEDDRESEEKH
ncbi:MAG: glutamyl-tRNA reductase [Desulfobacterota bacterium]|nr:glutamyl-tRNA reductase [Thermodesulfobacteriota bacterium]